MLNGAGDIGAAFLRVVFCGGEGLDFDAWINSVANEFGELHYCKFFGVSNIDGEVEGGLHERDEAVDKVVNVLKGAGLLALAVNGHVLAAEGLEDEI